MPLLKLTHNTYFSLPKPPDTDEPEPVLSEDNELRRGCVGVLSPGELYRMLTAVGFALRGDGPNKLLKLDVVTRHINHFH